MDKNVSIKPERKDLRVISFLLAAFIIIVTAHFLAIDIIDEHDSSTGIIRESMTGSDLLRSLDHHLVELESSTRSFVILEDEKYLPALEESIQKIRTDLPAIKVFFKQTAREEYLDQLEELVTKKVRFNQDILLTYRSGGRLAAESMLGSGQGILLRENILTLTDSLRRFHLDHLNNHLDQRLKISERLRFFSWISLLGIFVLVAISIYHLLLNSRKRRLAEQEKHQNQNQLEQNLLFIKDLFEHAPIGYHSTDAEGRILEMNQTALDWLGYPREEVVGKMNIQELAAPENEEAVKALRQELERTGKLDSIQGTLRCKDGRSIDILASSRAVFDVNGKYVGNRTAVMDFTVRKKLEESLQEAQRAAERSALLKEQFVANMSHEIRTPLNAILGFSNLLQRTRLLDDQREFARHIQTSSENLLSIVNDILDFSKIEAGALRLESIPFSISGLLHSVETMFRFRAEEKKLRFEVSWSKEMPDTLLGDPTRLTQILMNLLGNAFKFTEEGSVCLTVEVAKEMGEGQVVLRFTIQDTGIGIAPDKLEFIFERFAQASAETTRRFGGAGLGLAISRQLVELQGGVIRAALPPNGPGAVFSFELPYRIAESAGKAPNGQEPAGNFQNSNATVLIVEDNPMNQRITELLLGEWGLGHDHAANGKVALDRLRTRTYDLILMDIQMPEMDGYTAARAIRQQLRLNVPIIATTAHAFAGEREKCLRHGMNDYISKPIKEDELRALLQRYLPEGRIIKQPGTPTPSAPPSPAGFDRQYVLDISRGRPELLGEMASLFVSQSARELAQMEKALPAGDFAGVAAFAHSMKSTVGYMGFAGSAGGMLEQMEAEARKETPNAALLTDLLDRIKKWRKEAVVFIERFVLEA